VREGDLSVFLIPLALAVAKDFLFDPLSTIPIIGQLVVGLLFCFPITVYLFVFMWGRGKMLLRLIFFFVALFDFIPFLNLIPFSSASVVFAYLLAKKDAETSKGEAKKWEDASSKLKGQLQGVKIALQNDALAERQAAEAESAAEEQANQERRSVANN
jgi:hypothetical protein